MASIQESLSEFFKFESTIEIVHQVGQLSDLEEGEVLLDNEVFYYTVKKTDHKCTVCAKSFSQKGNLMRHLRMHEGVKPFRCELCGHEFAQKANLKKHMDAHNAKKDFVCNECHKTFVQKVHLVRPLKIHSGEMPFKCNICTRPFSQKSKLKRHMKVHSDAKSMRQFGHRLRKEFTQISFVPI